MKSQTVLFFVPFFSLLTLHAAPLELDILRQQYDKMVTAPYEEGMAALATKYGGALGAAARTAQQSGLHDDVVALTQGN